MSSFDLHCAVVNKTQQGIPNNAHLQVRSKMCINGMRSSIQMSMNSRIEMSTR